MHGLLEKKLIKAVAAMLIVLVGLIALAPRADAAFVPSSESAAAIRAHDLDTLRQGLEQKMVRERLEGLGYSTDEVQARLARLSDSEVHSLAGQMESLEQGGIWGVIIGVVVIAGLIYLLWWLGKDEVVQVK
jgi:predicted phage tail protein